MFEFADTYAFYIIVFGDSQNSPVRAYDPELENYAVHYSSLTRMILHSAEWLESAYYDKSLELWQVTPEADAQLQVKYRVRESIHPEVFRWLE